jgi:hypothetical protein
MYPGRLLAEPPWTIREAVLNAARPLPPNEDSLIGDLTEDEDRLFLDGVLEA